MNDCPEAVQSMRAKRDDLFSALATMAWAEAVAFKAQDAALKALCDPFPSEPFHNELPEDRPSAQILERYARQLRALAEASP